MATPKWPHDHSEKHAAAAKKGWATRRRSGFGMTAEGVIVRHRTTQAAKVTRPKPAPAKPAKPKAAQSDGMERLRQREAALRAEVARLDASFNADIASGQGDRQWRALHSTSAKRANLRIQLQGVQTRLRNLGGK